MKGLDIVMFYLALLDDRKPDADLDEIIARQQKLLDEISRIRKNQIKRIKEFELQTRRSLLFLDLLAETKNLILYAINLLKSQRDFILELNKNKDTGS